MVLTGCCPPAVSLHVPSPGEVGAHPPPAPPPDHAPGSRRGFGGDLDTNRRSSRRAEVRRRTSTASRRSESCPATRNRSLWLAVATARWNSRSIWTLASRSEHIVRNRTMVSSILAMSSAVARSAASRQRDLKHARTSSILGVVLCCLRTKWCIESRTVWRRRPRSAAGVPLLTSSTLALRAPDTASRITVRRDAELLAQLAPRRERSPGLRSLDASSRGSRR